LLLQQYQIGVSPETKKAEPVNRLGSER